MSKLGTLTALALMTASLFNLGCNGMGSKAGGVDGSLTPLPIFGRHSAEISGITTPGVFVVANQEDLAAQNSDVLTQWANENVDLSRYSIIVLAAGEQGSGGYWAYVDSAQREGDTLYVQGKVNRPASGSAATTVMTSPFSAAIVSQLPDDLQVIPEIEGVQGQPAPDDSTLAFTAPEPEVEEAAVPADGAMEQDADGEQAAPADEAAEAQ